MALDNKKSTSLKDGYGTTYQSNGGEFNLDSKMSDLVDSGVFKLTNWYYSTDHDRKIQVSAAVIASLYGLFFVLYLLINQTQSDYELTWRFYGLGGLVTTPLLFGYMVGNLGVSPSTGEVVE